jgi:hypothetical protein
LRSKAKRLPADKGGTPKGALTVEDVCAIIKACQAGNVSSLKYRGLELELHPVYAHQVVDVEASDSSHEPPPVPPNARATEAELQAVRARMRELDSLQSNAGEHAGAVGGLDAMQSVESIENEIEQLLVTDPLAYEQMMNEDQEYQDAKPV